jgi:predicted DNA-binding transcriptional regulator AlpA
MMNRAVNEHAAAEILGVAVQSLRNWRCMREGPSYVKLGKAVRYLLADIEDYLQKRRVEPEAIRRET